MSKAAWRTKSDALPNLTPDLTLIAQLQARVSELEQQNERLRSRLKRMAEAVKREDRRIS